MRGTLVLLLSSLSLAAARGESAVPSYGKQIQPILTRYCVECHSTANPQGSLDLESYRGLLAGGQNGAAVVAGKPDQGRLVRMMEGTLKPVMPPRKARQPTPAEVALIRAWVAAGAINDGAAAVRRLPALAPRGKRATPVAALAWSPDGKQLAAAGRGEVLLLDAASGAVRHRLSAGRDRIAALAYSPRGDRLAAAASTAGEGHELRLWTIEDNTPASEGRLLTRHDDVIQAVAFSPDAKIVATAGYDRLIRLTEVGSGKELRVLRDHSDAVYSVAFSADGRLLASGGADRAVKVWDVASGARLYTLSESTDWVYAVAFSPAGKELSAAGVDRSLRVWSADERGGRLLHSTFAHEGPVSALAYTADGRTLYSLSEDRTVKAWTTARLTERHAYPAQADTPLALAVSPDDRQLAVGRFDGVLALLDTASGKTLRQPLPVQPAPPVLEQGTPDSLTRGRSARWQFRGRHLADARLVTTVPGMKMTAVSAAADRLTLDVEAPANTPPGKYSLRLKNEAGESTAHPFLVDRFPTVGETEGNDAASTGQRITLPVTVAGAIRRAGAIDWFRFDAVAGQEVGVELLSGTLGSPLQGVLTLLDPDGTVVAESSSGAMGHVCRTAGGHALAVRDAEWRGEPAMTYRLSVGAVPVVSGCFPPGVQRGTTTEVRLRGVHLGKQTSLRVTAPADALPGTKIALALPAMAETPPGQPGVVVGEFPEVTAGGSNDLPTPGTANGLIAAPATTQTWRVQARKGQRLILEVHAARLGSPLDSTLEVLDAAGQPLPRAVLRSLARTYVAFRDHDSRSPGIRLETWGELAVNDYLLLGNELLRIRALPRNPDDDCRFFEEEGQRIGYLGTTPTHQPQGAPLYKVSLHPPGTRLTPNGLPLVTLFWRNDDAAGLGKDSRLEFDPPADGTYLLRVGDSRGQGSPGHAYRLTARPPRPDFEVRLSLPATVGKGSAAPVRVNVRRIDAFDGVIDLKLTGLPAGFHAPATNLPADDDSTAFALSVDASAAAPVKAGPVQLIARATVAGKEVTRTAEGTLPQRTETGDIVTTTQQAEVALRPGGQARVTVRVERRNGFKGRIPLDVQGLPHGVRVLDVGLNGILITEAETVRTIELYCEPWVKPVDHPIVVLARREGKTSEHAAPSLLLRVAK